MCRILIGSSVRLMLVFDVFQGSMLRPKLREKGGVQQRDCWETLWGLWDLEGQRDRLHSLPGDGFIVCPTASDTLISIVFASCETKRHFWHVFFYTTLYKTVVQRLTVG